MASRRVQRLNEQLKREIAGLLRTEVHDPRVLGVTVTGVEVAPDLTLARIWVRLSEEDETREAALDGLAAASSFIRRQLGARLRIRRVPELSFREDRTLQRATRIEELLREVRTADDGGGADEGGREDDASETPEEGEPEA